MYYAFNLLIQLKVIVALQNSLTSYLTIPNPDKSVITPSFIFQFSVLHFYHKLKSRI